MISRLRLGEGAPDAQIMAFQTSWSRHLHDHSGMFVDEESAVVDIHPHQLVPSALDSDVLSHNYLCYFCIVANSLELENL
jgi:hypothetical protein